MIALILERGVMKMTDYKEMYIVLFRSVTNAITILEKAQQQVEEMYVSEQQTEMKRVGVQALEEGFLDKE